MHLLRRRHPLTWLMSPCGAMCRLGAVSGCLGDCCRAVGDTAGTLQHYRRSVELLQEAGSNPEVRSHHPAAAAVSQPASLLAPSTGMQS
jgi:hypothetical protein